MFLCVLVKELRSWCSIASVSLAGNELLAFWRTASPHDEQHAESRRMWAKQWRAASPPRPANEHTSAILRSSPLSPYVAIKLAIHRCSVWKFTMDKDLLCRFVKLRVKTT